MKNKILSIILTIYLGVLSVSTGAVSALASDGGNYITDLQIMSGADAVQKLEEAGYTPIEQSLNPVNASDESSFVYLGYKMGSSSAAITDIKVGTGGRVNADGINYDKVSDISLNQGAGGQSIYLYISHDKSAGDQIRGIELQTVKSADGFESGDKFFGSDGSEIVRDEKGQIADLDEGISDSKIYLKMYKGNIYRPYIDEVVAVKASSEEQAMEKIASYGCTYYLGYSIEGDGADVYLGYTRTDDEEKALRALIGIPGKDDEIDFKDTTYQKVTGDGNKALDGYSFYATKDETAGEPIMDLVAYGYGPEDTDRELQEDDEKNTIDTEEEQEKTQEESDGNADEPVVSDDEAIDEEETSQENVQNEESTEVESKSELTDNSKNSAADEKMQIESDSKTSAEDAAKTETNEELQEDDADMTEDTTQDAAEDDKNTQEDTGAIDNESGDDEAVSDDESITQDDTLQDEEVIEDEQITYASGIRVYKEIYMGDYISQYYLRGGAKGALRYLYDESEYKSALVSQSVLWISNIYCSNKDGKQFINNVGYVTKSGKDSTGPFDTIYSLDKKSANTTATAINKDSSNRGVALIVLIVSVVVLGGFAIKRKAGK